ncbi:hypothetical protein R1sor_022625 [Riccia sorocarpa]|uniref:Uncharacterized protein n=1 Tax=Riccia sorocarpa TaxID=122646 RepID=A0ABD3GRB0_9MARC
MKRSTKKLSHSHVFMWIIYTSVQYSMATTGTSLDRQYGINSVRVHMYDKPLNLPSVENLPYRAVISSPRVALAKGDFEIFKASQSCAVVAAGRKSLRSFC